MRNERARPQQCWKSFANKSNIVVLRFGDHGTKEILGVVGWKVWLVSNFGNNIQQHAKGGCKRTQRVTSNKVGSCWPTMLRPFARGLSSNVFEWRASTGSEIFSLLICLCTTKFVLLSVLTLIETICPNVCSKSSVPKAHFQSMCVAQERRCINSLLLRFTAPNPRSGSGRDMRRTWSQAPLLRDVFLGYSGFPFPTLVDSNPLDCEQSYCTRNLSTRVGKPGAAKNEGVSRRRKNMVCNRAGWDKN